MFCRRDLYEVDISRKSYLNHSFLVFPEKKSFLFAVWDLQTWISISEPLGYWKVIYILRLICILLRNEYS